MMNRLLTLNFIQNGFGDILSFTTRNRNLEIDGEEFKVVGSGGELELVVRTCRADRCLHGVTTHML
jgi:hypothetical protein